MLLQCFSSFYSNTDYVLLLMNTASAMNEGTYFDFGFLLVLVDMITVAGIWLDG